MADSGESIAVRGLSDRAKRFFGPAERPSLMHDGAPKKKGKIITFCLLASCLLWFTFSMQETYTQYFDFPTELQNILETEALTELPPEVVRVQVEGEGIQLLRLYYNPPKVPLDTSQPVIDLEVVTSEVTGNVRSASVTPTSIVVQKEAKSEKRIPVRSLLRINTTPGYHIVGPVTLTPDSVTVRGAVSILAGLSYWNSSARQLNSVRDSVRVTIPLSDTLSGLLELSATEIQVEAAVLQFTEGRREIDVRVMDSENALAVSFEPARTTVTYQVPLEQYDLALAATDFYAFVPLEEIRSDTTGNVYPLVNPPEGLILREIRIFPDAFRYYHNLSAPE